MCVWAGHRKTLIAGSSGTHNYKTGLRYFSPAAFIAPVIFRSSKDVIRCFMSPTYLLSSQTCLVMTESTIYTIGASGLSCEYRLIRLSSPIWLGFVACMGFAAISAIKSDNWYVHINKFYTE